MNNMSKNPLGKTTEYAADYSPHLLFAISRLEKRVELKLLHSELPFHGEDIWTAYELSWLNNSGLPQVAIGEFRISANSESIVESKSLKLYLNSFNQTKFADMNAVEKVIRQDLSTATNSDVFVKLSKVEGNHDYQVAHFSGELIDNLEVEINHYHYAPELLSANSNHQVSETLYSHLLKSNCLITHQPDWASVLIDYKGPQIDRQSLLKYIVSFRNHNEFHEQCVERMFCDIKRLCTPDKLTVYARYTRRGGLDINPWRSDFSSSMDNIRLKRQ